MSKDFLKTELCNKLIIEDKLKEMDVITHNYTRNRMSKDPRKDNFNNISPSLTTRPDCLGVCVNTEPKVIGGIGEKKSNGGTQYYEQNRIYDANQVATCIPASSSFHPYYGIETGGQSSEYLGTYQFAKSDNFMQGKDRFQENKEVSDCLQTSPKEGVVEQEILEKINNGEELELKIEKIEQVGIPKLRIRKLTGKECYRLMGFDDKDYERASKVISESMIYHTAGDSIAVNVLEEIFKKLL